MCPLCFHSSHYRVRVVFPLVKVFSNVPNSRGGVMSSTVSREG